jgi:hypothetical protein
MTTVEFPTAIARILRLPSHAITDGSDHPVLVEVRPVGIVFPRSPMTLPIDRAGASDFAIQNRLLVWRVVGLWASLFFLVSQLALFLMITATPEQSSTLVDHSGNIFFPWFFANALGMLALSVTQLIIMWRVRSRRPESYPTVQAGRVRLSYVNPYVAEEWQQLNDQLEVTLYPDAKAPAI